jgi:ELWxxDGT repeat protein
LSRPPTLFLAIFVTLRVAASDLPYLVRDLPGFVTHSALDYRAFWTTIDGTAWFTADPGSSRQVWRTDGTIEGTLPVSNGWVYNGRSHAEGTYIGAVNGRLIYSGFGATEVFSLGQTGGTPVNLANVPAAGVGPGVVYDGELYFNAQGILWRTDGTPPGTASTGFTFSSGPSHPPLEFQGGLYFCGRTAAGEGLHRLNADANGPHLVKTLRPDDASGRGCRVTALSDRLIFWEAGDSDHVPRLWVSDGTEGGAVAVQSFSPEARFDLLGKLDGTLLFTTEDGSFTRLWRTDGTAAGTQPFHEIGRDQLPAIASGAVIGSRYFFVASIGVHEARRTSLFVTDGTPGSVTEITSAVGPGFALNGKFFFIKTDPLYGSEWWSSDGTAAGTHLLLDIEPGVGSGAVDTNVAFIGSSALFAARTFDTGSELWTTDGTAGGTRLLKNIGVDDVQGSDPRLFAVSNGNLFFLATLPRGPAIGRSNGTAAGTTAQVIWPYQRVVYTDLASGNRYFAYYTPDQSGRALIASDGVTPETTTLYGLARDVMPVPAGNGVVFVRGATGGYLDLWFTDGTAAGTRAVLEIEWPVSDVAVTTHQGLAWLARRHLWKSDGTAAGTKTVPTAASPSSVISNLVSAGDDLYFIEDEGSERLLHRLEPLYATSRVVARFPDGDLMAPREFFPAGNLLFFRVNDEIWRTDGTEAGTVPLVRTASMCQDTAAIGSTLFWFTSEHGGKKTLWRSDGTSSGTMRVWEMWPDLAPLDCPTIAAAGGKLYFTGSDIHGEEPWVSDGTAGGTRLLMDLHPGRGSSNPREFTTVGDRVFFTAYTLETRRELWAIDTRGPARRRSVRH